MYLNFNNSCTYTIATPDNLILATNRIYGNDPAFFTNATCLPQITDCAFYILEVRPAAFIIKSMKTYGILSLGKPLSGISNNAEFIPDYLEYGSETLFHFVCTNASNPQECYIFQYGNDGDQALSISYVGSNGCDSRYNAVLTKRPWGEAEKLLFWENCGDRAGTCDTTVPFYPEEASAGASSLSLLGIIGVSGLLMLLT